MLEFRRCWYLPLTLSIVACVPGVPHFVTSAESRAGQPYENAEYQSAELAVADAEPEDQTKEGELRTTSYWHYNGLGYERVSGHVEARSRPYLWPWRDDPAQ